MTDPPKLAFGFQKSKAARKIAVNVEDKGDKRQLITGIEGSVIKTAEPEQSEEKKVYIVPKLENTFKTGVGKKFVPSYVPPANDAPIAGTAEDRFEHAEQDTRPSVTGYGLERRARPGEGGQEHAEPDDRPARPLVSAAQLELQAFKRDMEELPDQATVEVRSLHPCPCSTGVRIHQPFLLAAAPCTATAAITPQCLSTLLPRPLQAYESMPIEEFGKAMLLGMGWKEGLGVGRNRKVAEPIEYLRRPERLGLGAAPAPLDPDAGKKKVVKMGELVCVHACAFAWSGGAWRTENVKWRRRAG